MTASATAKAVTTWRALVGVEVMGGEYIADEIAPNRAQAVKLHAEEVATGCDVTGKLQ